MTLRLIFLFVLSLSAAPASAVVGHRTEDVFKSFENRVVRVRVLEKSSQAQTAVGSGFFVGKMMGKYPGLALTNYHVVSKLLWNPEDYRGEVLFSNGKTAGLTLLNVDVVHDLALIAVDASPVGTMPLALDIPLKGERLFAMGNPHDLGLTIVEGTYSGLLEESLFQKVHFTGSINPGMSGGPVLTPRGLVVGVCVASAGNQVGFLVPVKFARSLLSPPEAPPTTEDLKKIIAAQLLQHQNSIFKDFVAQPFATQAAGSFRAPGQVSKAFKCWGHANEGKEKNYRDVHAQCSTEDEIFIKDALSTGKLSFSHHGLESSSLNAFRFASLLENRLMSNMSEMVERTFSWIPGFDDESKTPFECAPTFVKAGNLSMKGSLCLSAYKDLPGLYDVTWRAVSLNSPRKGVATSLRLEGISLENAEGFLRRYWEGFSWEK